MASAVAEESRHTLDTEGIIALVRALAARCECESGDVQEECKAGALDRWWVHEILG